MWTWKSFFSYVLHFLNNINIYDLSILFFTAWNDQPTTNEDLPEDPEEPQDGHDELEDDLEELGDDIEDHPEVGAQKKNF